MLPKKKTTLLALDCAEIFSREEPEKVYYVVDRERCATRFTANTDMLALYIGRGYHVIAKFQNGVKML